MTLLTWIGIALCLSQSAMLSGLNLAYFTISKLELKMEVAKGNKHAHRVLTLRKDANFLLVTILWCNVAVNVLLALLSGSVLTGISAFLFSTVIITIFGEIFPQAYFSRHALLNAERFNPYRHCHRPVIVTSGRATIGDVIARLKVNPQHSQDDVVDHDVILLWSETRRIITGGDILGRLLRGIVQNPAVDQGRASNLEVAVPKKANR